MFSGLSVLDIFSSLGRRCVYSRGLDHLPYLVRGFINHVQEGWRLYYLCTRRIEEYLFMYRKDEEYTNYVQGGWRIYYLCTERMKNIIIMYRKNEEYNNYVQGGWRIYYLCTGRMENILFMYREDGRSNYAWDLAKLNSQMMTYSHFGNK